MANTAKVAASGVAVISTNNENAVNASVDQVDDTDLDISDDYVDPRVQVELEKLNSATDAINKLEVELDEARALFRQRLSESSHRIKSLAKKLGNCIEKARPYYEARVEAKDAHAETQKAALRFERANSAHAAAKEMVFLSEEGLQKEGRTFDPAWQEMLNHATMRVNEAERERTFGEQEHKLTSQSYNEAEQKVQYLQKELKRTISKSRPYFEMKAQFFEVMEEQKQQVHQLEEQIFYVKQSYAFALRSLEQISDEIHQRRQLKHHHQALGSRGPGVGAESPVPPIPEKDANHIDVNSSINTDDAYLKLPQKLGHLNNVTRANSNSLPSGQENIQGVKKKVVDNGSQTDIENARSCPLSHGTDERISAWVQESGLRAQSTPRKSSLMSNGPQGLAAMFLNMHEDSDMSDAESLNSTDVLTDEQIASLMLDKDLDEAYQDILVSPRVKESTSLKAPESILNNILHFNKATSASESDHLSSESVNNAGDAKVLKVKPNKNSKDTESEECRQNLVPANNVAVETAVVSEEAVSELGNTHETFKTMEINHSKNTQKDTSPHVASHEQVTIDNSENRQSLHLQKSKTSNLETNNSCLTTGKNPSTDLTHTIDPNDTSLQGQQYEIAQTEMEQLQNRATQTPQAAPCQTASAVRLTAKSEFGSNEKKSAEHAGADVQEFQVVAVQFTLQETRVLPKITRSISHKENSSTEADFPKPQQSEETVKGQSVHSSNVKSRSASYSGEME